MANILNFKKPKSPKKNDPFAMKVMIGVLILLALLKLPEVFNEKLALYRKHEVSILSSPINIPEDYSVYDLNGNNIKLSQTLGDNITVIVFWATWCGYCAQEMPFIDKRIQDLSNHGVKILPIARGDDTPEKVKQFFERGNISNLESVIASNRELHKELGINSYPAYIAVDKNGMAFARMRPNWRASDILTMFDKLSQSSN